jgi:predicted MFS family arabinose efflux permease
LTFLVPILLVGMGSTQSEIGRTAMVYGLVVVALVPVFAWCCERFETYALAVGLGGMLTGLGLLSLQWEASPRAVVFGIAALGLGHSMSISAQLVLVTRATQAEALLVGSGPVLGVFRLMERLGAAAGPVAAGLLVASLGAPQATVWLGVFGVAASVLFTFAFFLTGRLAPRSHAA